MIRFTSQAAQTAPMRIIPSEMRQVIPTARTAVPSLAEKLMQMPSRTLSSAQTAPIRTISSEMRRTIPTTRAAVPSFREKISQMPSRALSAYIPMTTRIPTGMGDIARTLPTGRSVVSPVIGDRTGIIPPSTLSTQGRFGGESGGMGAAAGTAPVALGPASLSGVGSSIGKIGTDVMNTVTSLVPLAIKVVLAVIVIKIVLWLLRGRR